MEYWGYIEKDELNRRFNKAFPDVRCPDVDVFFAVGENNIIRKILSDRIPVGVLDSDVNNIIEYYDEHLCVSNEGMKWLLSALCKYVIKQHSGHEIMMPFLLLYIQDSGSSESYDFHFLSDEQKEALFNFLEYCSEMYDVSVFEEQKILEHL
ncbi:hypothetical protein MOU97_002523 [Vibrio vulnificus]|uniref:hypothetical protein n=1 Tax=Vibrio vulnificus TaxID=672 RepID=UPI0005763957|nr:hypothetical protein [Vibrio vulnificus]EIV1775406.1 hypothetical protein [Vibrio vulnificus]EIZ0990425.1 hypothetical protein [Vibrio vulnificus]EJT1339492.1 hypothetical protein [Vibrio vulnificus]EJV2651097.1 hypothetical protein [Vibrio vulnificus]ELV8744063.1 hypothetical protein [Vibrio vulnificus]